jgi:8-oxo-dGTP pyrophosphatase MutT (NUDIX family)
VLDLKLDRPAAAPIDAATMVLVRDAARTIEVFCVERSKKSRFLGGAVVFPGGKLDAGDGADAWASLVTDPRAPTRAPAEPFARDAAHLRALAVAAARETLEEAALLHVARGAVGHDEALALRAELTMDPAALRRFLAGRGLLLDLDALHPFARWITPVSEARRYDARFFVAIAPPGQHGAHDEHETMSSFWAPPAEVLRRWAAGEIQIAPPTHATLAQLAACATTDAVLAHAAAGCLDPVCPRAVPQRIAGEPDALALVLPGDPEHDVRERRVPGPSRYVLRGDRWMPEDAPR